MKSVTTLLLILILSVPASSQPWMESLTADQQQNFYSIQKSFENYWKGKDTKEKGKGWKQFKRWEWFWRQRVYPSGNFPDPMQLYNEYLKTAPRRGRAPEALGGDWTSMGPSQSPGGYAGLGRINCVRTDPNNPNILWAGSPSGGLWKSTDSGATWSTNTDELPSIGVTDIVIDPANSNSMFMATGDGDAGDTYSVGVLKSGDGGATWNATGLNWTTSQVRRISRLLMYPGNPNILIAAGSGIWKTTDGGTTWSQKATGTFRDMEFKPGDPTVMYASSSGGQVRKSTNSGDAWSLLSNGIPTSGGRVALGVSPANPATVYALYASSSNSGFAGLYRSTDSGTSWTLMSSSPNILGWALDGSDVGGQGWYDLAVAVSPFNADELYTGGVDNWKSTDGGATWTIISMWYGGTFAAEVHADQHDLWFIPGTNTLYVGNDGGVYKTVDGGSTWTWLGNGLKTTQFYRLGLSATDPARLIAGAQDNGTKLLTSGGWDDVIGGDGMEGIVDYTNANIMYGSLYYGNILKSVNGGSNFSSITGSITESGGWITPYVMHPTNHSTLFAGYVNVWKTTDAGSSWSPISTFGSGNLDIVEVAPSNPQIIYAGQNATLRRTTDGGATWNLLTTPAGAGSITALAIKPTNPDSIWVTSSGYSAGNKVFQSTNGGAAWTNISGSLPNVPANTVVYERLSLQRLYVGTDIGVYYRDQDMPDWQDFNTGLPNVIISELEIQYGTKKIRAATYGRGIWESPLVPSTAAQLTCSPDSLLAAVAEGDSTSLTITIGNSGTASLTWNTVSGVSWLRTNPTAGTVLPGNSQPVSAFLKAVTPGGTSQQTNLLIYSNDPAANPLSVPVQLDVQMVPQSLTIPVADNWNIVSVPLLMSDYRKSVLFPTSSSDAFAYQAGVGYQVEDTLRPGPGYWLKFPAAQGVPLSGFTMAQETVAVAPNWNIIGSISTPIPASAVVPLGTTIISPFYIYTPSGFSVTDSLRPGRGTWVKVDQSGKLVLRPPAPGPVSMPRPAGTLSKPREQAGSLPAREP